MFIVPQKFPKNGKQLLKRMFSSFLSTVLDVLSQTTAMIKGSFIPAQYNPPPGALLYLARRLAAIKYPKLLIDVQLALCGVNAAQCSQHLILVSPI